MTRLWDGTQISRIHHHTVGITMRYRVSAVFCCVLGLSSCATACAKSVPASLIFTVSLISAFISCLNSVPPVPKPSVRPMPPEAGQSRATAAVAAFQGLTGLAVERLRLRIDQAGQCLSLGHRIGRDITGRTITITAGSRGRAAFELIGESQYNLAQGRGFARMLGGGGSVLIAASTLD